MQDEEDEEGDFIYSDIEGPNTDVVHAPAPAELLLGREQGPNDLLQEILHAMQPEVVPIPVQNTTSRSLWTAFLRTLLLEV